MQENLYNEVLRHHNEPVLICFELGRIVGYAEDLDDCYMIVKFPRKDKPVWLSMCGGYTYLLALKGQNSIVIDGVEWDDFIRLDNLLTLNGVPKEEFTFTIED